GHHRQRAHRVGLERDRPPPPYQQRPRWEAGMVANRNGECRPQSVMLQQGIRAAEAGSGLDDLGGVESATDDAGIGVRPGWETEAQLSEHAQRVSGPRLKDRRAVGPPMRERAIDREDAGFERSRASSDGQQTFETREV